MPFPAFLDKVVASADLVQKLASLGAETPSALLAMINASRELFDRFVGKQEAEQIVRRLRDMVPRGRSSVGRLRAPPGKMGVPLRPAPAGPTPPHFDVGQRDQMFSHIRQLRQSGASAEEIRQAEQELDAFLRG